MTSNGYLDTSVQKAFLPGIPGCLEQYEKLSSVIGEAHRKHRSLAVCWLDLANAYGSVHHALIKYALERYHAPPCFLSLISNLYTDLSATITCKSWSTRKIPLQIGVYQGDPLSVIIFNTVMATLSDALAVDRSLGYTFSHSSRSIHVLQYADDTCLVASGPANCQQMLNRVEEWLIWSGMKAKVPKCYSMAISASSGKRYDPRLKLSGQNIPFIAGKAIKFLGVPITIPLTNRQQKEHLIEKLGQLLERVDRTPVTRRQKLLLYKAGICPRVSWDLAILNLPTSWISSTLESKATYHLKKWSGLAKCADPSRLYLPKMMGGLQLPSITMLYKKLKISQASLMFTSRDPIIQHIVRRRLEKEDSLQRVSFRPMRVARDVMAEDPGVSKHQLVSRTKIQLNNSDATIRHQHTIGLQQQGQMMRCTTERAACIWSAAINNLPSGSLKFILNAATNTLPHNSNLALWRKSDGVLSDCKLCGKRQTLLHILNNCAVACDLRRYNFRHDAVLEVIADLIKGHLQPGQEMVADLPSYHYNYPLQVGTTDLRPDIVIWQNKPKVVTILELTVCYETNFDEAKNRKICKYVELLEEAEHNGYKSEMITIEVGSRGVLSLEGFDNLKKSLLQNVGRKKWKSFLTKISQTVILESQKIWRCRNWRDSNK